MIPSRTNWLSAGERKRSHHAGGISPPRTTARPGTRSPAAGLERVPGRKLASQGGAGVWKSGPTAQPVTSSALTIAPDTPRLHDTTHPPPRHLIMIARAAHYPKRPSTPLESYPTRALSYGIRLTANLHGPTPDLLDAYPV